MPTTLEQQIETWARSTLPIYEFMDLKINSVSNGLFKCTVPLNKNTGNHLNTMHAAMQFAAAEILGGIVIISTRDSEKYIPIVRDIKINFRKPVTNAISAEASFTAADATKMNEAMQANGRYDFDLCATLKNDAGEIVADTQASYSVRMFD